MRRQLRDASENPIIGLRRPRPQNTVARDRRNAEAQRSELPKRCAMETRMTAPRVAAASEYKKPPPKIPNLIKIQPPRKDPISPITNSGIQPKPRPRAILPRSEERRVGKGSEPRWQPPR